MLPLEVSYNAKCDLMPRAQMSSTVDILWFFLLEHVAYMPHTIVIEKIVSQSVSQSVSANFFIFPAPTHFFGVTITDILQLHIALDGISGFWR